MGQKIFDEIKDAGLAPQKRGRGRPKGSKNKHPRKMTDAYLAKNVLIDPKTGIAVRKERQKNIIGHMGDERVSAFVQYHIDMMAMRQGVNKKDVTDLYRRFLNYLAYCKDHGIIPNNMNCYYAIGVTKDDMSYWRNGKGGTPEHREFAQDVASFFASIHEQGALDGVINPINSIFWQKAYDGLSDQPKVEVTIQDPLGEKRSAADIVKQYSDLPD